MGNTDTLHPNSCFCCFSIPTSRIKIFYWYIYNLQSILNEVQISVSVDSPEGGFDALVQAMACPEVN